MKNLNNIKQTINDYNEEEVLELRKMLLGYEDDYAQWEETMHKLYEGSKKSILRVEESAIFTYFLKFFKDTIYETEMLDLFLELNESVERIIKKIDKRYFEACRYIESVLSLRYLENKTG